MTEGYRRQGRRVLREDLLTTVSAILPTALAEGRRGRCVTEGTYRAPLISSTPDLWMFTCSTPC